MRDSLIHVEFANGTHHYFGSIAAIFTVFDEATIGVKPNTLYKFGIDINKPYRNKHCTIHRSVVVRKDGDRNRPSKK